MMDETNAVRLQKINAELKEILLLLAPEGTLHGKVASPAILMKLLTNLQEAETIRGGGDFADHSAGSTEMQTYRNLLAAFLPLLPALHQYLLVERERVVGEREKIETASAWAKAASLAR